MHAQHPQQHRQLLLRDDALRARDGLAVQRLERGQHGRHKLSAPVPVRARVAHEVDLAQHPVVPQLGHRLLERVQVDEVDGQVELVQELARAQALDALDVVQRQVEVLEVLAVGQVFDLGDDVVLQVQNLNLPADVAHGLDPLDLELVQRDLLEIGQDALVVLGLFADQRAREPHHGRPSSRPPRGQVEFRVVKF